MAIDTAAKRRSALTTSVAWGPPSVTPDAAKGSTWRASAGWGYEGIAAGAALLHYVVARFVPRVFHDYVPRAFLQFVPRAFYSYVPLEDDQ